MATKHAARTHREVFVEAKGLSLRVRRQGSGEPLLLINGLGGCLEGWAPLVRQLPGRELIMVDHPGTGLSDVPQHLMSMGQLAAMYVAVLDSLEFDRVDVLGFSFGGTVTQQIARDFPERVRSIILAATSPGFGGFPADPMTLMVASNPFRYQFTSIREMSAPLLYRGRVGREPGLFETELRGWTTHTASMKGVFFQVAAFSVWSSLPWLRTLNVPTLVLGGQEDPMAPATNSRLLAAAIRGARLRLIDQGGHLFLFDRASETAPVIEEFLRSHRAAAAA